MADVAIYSPRFRGRNPSPRTVSKANVIFCRSDKVEEFLSDYHRRITAKVLILGNSDRDFYQFNFNLPSSIKVVFAQNLSFLDPRFRCLPIGLENIRLAWNGFPDLYRIRDNNYEKREEILFGPFGKTHKEREEMLAFQDLEGPWTFTSTRFHPIDYESLTRQFRFIAAPRGNGIDTHRFWETLYRGSVPIVKKSTWSDNLAYLGIPFVGIEDWSADSVVRGIKDYPVKELRPQDISEIWWPSWSKRIASYL
jgi:hypothetical protein